MPGSAVVVGVLEVRLAIDAADSLKEKRSVVKRLVERTKNRFNVSVAEVGANDEHRRAIIGIVTVANDGPFVNSVLDKVLDYLEEEGMGLAEIIDTRMEIQHY
ncbi:DUF503 domain-containing protein [Myxococcota bacterium]|nr:DUF503 domain-containing protein [Myxococcota bacterium]